MTTKIEMAQSGGPLRVVQGRRVAHALFLVAAPRRIEQGLGAFEHPPS